MIPLSVAFLAALHAVQNQPVDLYELYLPDGTAVYLADRDITWGGHHYLPYIESRSDIRRYLRGQFDQVTFTISNVDMFLAQLLANHDIEGGTLIIRRIDVTVMDDSLPLFCGLLQQPGAIDEMHGSLTAMEYLGGIDYDAPGRYFSVFCGFPFKGAECGYTGANTDCDHSWSNCAMNNNTPRFGGFRFFPHSGTYQYQTVTQERFLLFFSRKKVQTVSATFNSLDDTPYDVPIPIVLGRVQLQAIPMAHEDVGPEVHLLAAFCVGKIYFFTYILANNAQIVPIAHAGEHYGELGGTGQQTVDSLFPSGYEYNLLAYIGIVVPSEVSTVDPAPAITAVVGGCEVDIYDFHGNYAQTTWTDNPVWNLRHFFTLPAAQGGLGLPQGWMDDASNFYEAVFCDEYITDATNDQKIYAPSALPDGFELGANYQRFRSTGVEGYDGITDGPYSTFVPGVDDDTSRSPDPVQVKRFTMNVAIAQQASAIDIVQNKLLPCFRGFTRQSKAGKIQICVERANPHTSVTANSAAGAMAIYCADPAQFSVGDLLIASTFTTRAECLTVQSVSADHIGLASASANDHNIGEELLKVAMHFNDANIRDDAPVQYPMTDRQSPINRVTVNYVDAPAGFEQRPLQVNDYEHQARVRKVNNEDFDGSGIDSFFQAWRIGQFRRAMYRDLGKFIQIPADIAASPLEVGDVFAATVPEFGLICLPFRVVELGFQPDDEVDVIGQLYSTGVYDDSAPQSTVRVPSVFKAGPQSARGPMPWKPFGQLRGIMSQYGFLILQQAAADNPGNTVVSIGGYLPQNVWSPTLLKPPRADLAGVVTAQAGANPHGTWLAQVFAIDANGLYSPGSTLTRFVITGANQRVTWNVTMDPAAAEYEVFIGPDTDRLVGQGKQAGPASVITYDTFSIVGPGTGWGPPDSQADHVRVQGKRETLPGVTGAAPVKVISSTETTVVIETPGDLAANEFAGYTLCLVSKAGLPATQTWSDAQIQSNATDGTLTVLTPQGLAFGSGDLVVIRPRVTASATNSVTSAKFMNPWQPDGLVVNGLVGKEVWILDDPGGIQVREIASNTATRIVVTQAFSPTPSVSAIFVVCEKIWTVDRIATPFTAAYTPDASGNPDVPIVANVDATALQGAVALWRVLIEDVNGNMSIALPDGVRDIYVAVITGDGGPVYTVPFIDGAFAPDLSRGLNQRIFLTAAGILKGPRGGLTANSSITWTLIVDQDAAGFHDLHLDDDAYFADIVLASQDSPPERRAQCNWILDQNGHNSLSGLPSLNQPIPA